MRMDAMKMIAGAMCLGTAVWAAPAWAQHDHHDDDAHATTEPAAAHGEADGPASMSVYPLTTDALTGEPLGDTPVRVEHEGRELRFANQANADAFAKDPAPALKRLDQRIIEAQAASYPVTTCPISGARLGSMGEPVDRVYGNRLVRFCCGGCPAAFEEDLQANLKKLDADSLAAQRQAYPLETCVVSGESLDAMGKPVEALVNGQLVRFCCSHCKKEFAEAPGMYLQKIEAARKAATDAAKGSHAATEHEGASSEEHEHAGHH